jgi:EAL domain-containing protein (putative c-di-GMP-specific phosphodiesterase class I)
VATVGATIVGVEALLRWRRPGWGLVSPAEFIPVAEQAGMITDIGRWVLGRACADRCAWTGPDGAGPELSVNVSARQLMSPDLSSTVAAVLDATGTDPAALTLEVTEDVFLQDSERALVVLNELKSLGVMLALDDFGTGYSSLSYLKRFPFDTVKIDRSFVADLAHDPASHAIVYTVTELAHLLGMIVVAEGVETAAQHQQVTLLGCDFAQGFYFAPPTEAYLVASLLAPVAGVG